MPRRTWMMILACAAGLAAAAGGLATTRTPAAAPSQAAASPSQNVTTVGVWSPPEGLTQIPIWPSGAPGMEGVSQPPESVLTAPTPEAIGGTTSQAVFDVVTPTMTVFPPKGRNTGVAAVVFPGGGFRALAITASGTEVCDWLTARGITCVLLKYRIPGSAHYWNPDCRCVITPKVPRALQDAQRTIRLVRSRAAELEIDPDKIGVIGFSAGGYMAAQASNIFEPAYAPVDAVDRISSRPDFAVLVYPGHICRSGSTFDPGLHVTARTPPTFLLQAWDDPVDDICNSTMYARALDQAGVRAEVHLFAKGGHAFGLRHRERPIAMWPSLVERWLGEIEVL